MPMDVNSVVIYLAIVLAGFVVVSIADSFAANEIATRVKLSKTKAIFTQVRTLNESLLLFLLLNKTIYLIFNLIKWKYLVEHDAIYWQL